MKIEADNLTNAYQKASDALGCSITELDVRVLQQPNAGFLGFFKKSAIIEAVKKGEKFSESEISPKKPAKKQNAKSAQTQPNARQNGASKARKEKQKALVTDEILKDIEAKLAHLIKISEFRVEIREVSAYDENNVYIKLDGEDSALLIGKEGHRYKAFSYMIYNWVSIKYNLSVVFEISEFLQNQIKYIDGYVAQLAQNASDEKIITKPFDGAFIKVVTDKIKTAFPTRNIGVKTIRNGKIVIIDEKN